MSIPYKMSVKWLNRQKTIEYRGNNHALATGYTGTLTLFCL